MKWILKAFDQYYISFDDEDSTFSMHFDPNYATDFSTKTAALDRSKKDTVIDEHVDAVKLTDAVKEFNEWVEGGMLHTTRPQVNHEHARLYDPETDTKESILNWWWEYRGTHEEVPTKIYKSWPKVWQHWTHIQEVEGYYDTDDFNNISRGFVLHVDRNHSYDTFEQEVNYLLEHFDIERVDKDGNIVFGIFDHFLSAHGNTVYMVKVGDLWKIEGGSYNRVPPSSLKAIFKYLKTNRYYK